MTGALAGPVRAEESIKQVVIGLILTSRPEPDAMREAISLHGALRQRYPRRHEHRANTFALNPAKGLVDGVEASELAGFSFDYVNPDGNVKQAILCVDQTLRVVQTDCSDLNQIWEKAYEEIAMVLPVLGQDVTNLVFERLDRFVWDGERSEFRAENLFRSETRWLTPNVFDARDIWHSHHGFFEYRKEPHPHRLLHVVEVATEDRPTEPAMTLVADVKQSLNITNGMHAPGERNRTMSTEELLRPECRLLHDYFSDLMKRTETVLMDLVNEDVYREIELGVGA